jgi:hypothetical protein
VRFALKLINKYGIDEAITTALDTYEWHFIVLSNPDGYEYTWTTVSHAKLRTIESQATKHEKCICVKLCRTDTGERLGLCNQEAALASIRIATLTIIIVVKAPALTAARTHIADKRLSQRRKRKLFVTTQCNLRRE